MSKLGFSYTKMGFSVHGGKQKADSVNRTGSKCVQQEAQAKLREEADNLALFYDFRQ